jgi:hypothetical protein
LANLDALTLILVWLAIFVILGIIAIWAQYGLSPGQWTTVAQGITKASLILVGIAGAMFVIAHLVKR